MRLIKTKVNDRVMTYGTEVRVERSERPPHVWAVYEYQSGNWAKLEQFEDEDDSAHALAHRIVAKHI